MGRTRLYSRLSLNRLEGGDIIIKVQNMIIKVQTNRTSTFPNPGRHDQGTTAVTAYYLRFPLLILMMI